MSDDVRQTLMNDQPSIIEDPVRLEEVLDNTEEWAYLGRSSSGARRVFSEFTLKCLIDGRKKRAGAVHQQHAEFLEATLAPCVDLLQITVEIGLQMRQKF